MELCSEYEVETLVASFKILSLIIFIINYFLNQIKNYLKEKDLIQQFCHKLSCLNLLFCK